MNRVSKKIKNLQTRKEYNEKTAILELELSKRLKILEDSEEAFWYNRSRELFLKCGDRNSKYFQIKSKGRQNANMINFIKADVSWLNNSKILGITFATTSLTYSNPQTQIFQTNFHL